MIWCNFSNHTDEAAILIGKNRGVFKWNQTKLSIMRINGEKGGGGVLGLHFTKICREFIFLDNLFFRLITYLMYRELSTKQTLIYKIKFSKFKISRYLLRLDPLLLLLFFKFYKIIISGKLWLRMWLKLRVR